MRYRKSANPPGRRLLGPLRAGGQNPKSKIASKTNQRGKIGIKVKGHVMRDCHHPTPRPWAPRKDLPQ